jgi:hypothetical protein
MSAFLASQQTYDYIASGLYDAAIRRDSEPHYTVRRFLELDNDVTDETLARSITHAVGKLYDLNRLALVTRYGDAWDRDNHFSLTITRAATINVAQLIKCLACVLYQCAEYLTHETETYKQWRDLEHQLAFNYFAGLPAYDAAQWDMAPVGNLQSPR